MLEFKIFRRLTFDSLTGRFFYVYVIDATGKHHLLSVYLLELVEPPEFNKTVLKVIAKNNSPIGVAVNNFLFQFGCDYTSIENVL